jgi:hypothetical protein
MMSSILTYNALLINERNKQPLLIAFVSTVAVWTVAVLIGVAGRRLPGYNVGGTTLSNTRHEIDSVRNGIGRTLLT